MTNATPDIVSLLRNRNHAQAPTLAESMMKQAADEIERLRKAAKGSLIVVQHAERFRNEAITEVSRLRSELAKYQWRTMESAPRDGTSILAVICGRHPGTGRPFIPEVVSYNENGYWDNCMWVDDGTHWLPLPEPPSKETK